MSWGVRRRQGSLDLVLLWLWHRMASAAPTLPLAWELSYAADATLKKKKERNFFFFVFSRAAPTAYGDSQARGLIGAIATGLSQSHSNVGSEPRLRPTPQLTATLDP